MNITALLQEHHILGVAIGAATFLIIGLFHPLVIRTLLLRHSMPLVVLAAGIIFMILAVAVRRCAMVKSARLVSFSSLWSIKEVVEQEHRVKKGWFPANPKRHNANTDKTRIG